MKLVGARNDELTGADGQPHRSGGPARGSLSQRQAGMLLQKESLTRAVETTTSQWWSNERSQTRTALKTLKKLAERNSR